MDINTTQLFDTPALPTDSVLGSKYLDPAYLFTQEASLFEKVWYFITHDNTALIYQNILIGLSIFFITVIIYSFIRLLEIRKKEHEHLHHEIMEYAEKHKKTERDLLDNEVISKNERWRQVLHLLFSENQNDWKLSVIEADAMLDVLLAQLGFKGETLGEKLKRAGEQGFRQLNTAWEIHTVRNRIAHEGSIFEISHHEAKRVIALYEQIFREFGYI